MPGGHWPPSHRPPPGQQSLTTNNQPNFTFSPITAILIHSCTIFHLDSNTWSSCCLLIQPSRLLKNPSLDPSKLRLNRRMLFYHNFSGYARRSLLSFVFVKTCKCFTKIGQVFGVVLQKSSIYISVTSPYFLRWMYGKKTAYLKVFAGLVRCWMLIMNNDLLDLTDRCQETSGSWKIFHQRASLECFSREFGYTVYPIWLDINDITAHLTNIRDF